MVYISCIVHDLGGAVGVVWKIQVTSFFLQIVHSWFMGLGNPIEVVAHYLPLGGMLGFDHQDEFLMMSALMCLGLTVSYDIRLLSCYDFIKLVHCVVSQP